MPKKDPPRGRGGRILKAGTYDHFSDTNMLLSMLFGPTHPIFPKSAVGPPPLDHGLKRGTPKALKGLPLSLLFCLSVCVSVDTLQVTIFNPATYFFHIFIAMGEKDFFRFTKFSFFTFLWHFFTFFHSFILFVFVLATSHPIGPTNKYFVMYGPYDIERAKKMFLKIFNVYMYMQCGCSSMVHFL